MKKSANIEILLISAIATIFVTRFFLGVTNYPQFGGGGLHIAHMLWGGLLLLVSIFLLLLFQLKLCIRLAALLGGIGFGLFIDELGKFITSDNNYFFEPTIALIYIIFVVLFFLLRFFTKFTHKDADIVIDRVNALFQKRFIFVEYTSSRVRSLYIHVLDQSWFTGAIILFFILYSLFHLYRSADVLSLFFRLNEFSLSFIEVGQFLSAIFSALIVVAGIIALRFSRRFAFGLFKDAVYVSILLTQFFDFYNNQFGALVTLVVNLVILVVLQYAIEHIERVKSHRIV